MSTKKTNKSVRDRIKIRKSGKIETRKKGQSHFNAKMNSKQKTRKGRSQEEKLTNKVIARELPHDSNA